MDFLIFKFIGNVITGYNLRPPLTGRWGDPTDFLLNMVASKETIRTDKIKCRRTQERGNPKAKHLGEPN